MQTVAISKLNETGAEPRAKADYLVVLSIEYAGARYQGMQLQTAGVPTIQGEIENALRKLTGQAHRIAAAGRTDSGASAQGQVVSFRPMADIPLQRYVTGLNHFLPSDISVTRAQWAAESFDVTRDARSRHYRYTIINRPSPSALLRQQAAHVREHLDEASMAQAILALSGWMDARPFTGPLPADRNPLRRYDDAQVSRDGDLVTIDICGNGFLPHQVRRIAGALIQVGARRMSVDAFHRLATDGEPGEATWTMPATGLCLISVTYDDGIVRD